MKNRTQSNKIKNKEKKKMRKRLGESLLREVDNDIYSWLVEMLENPVDMFLYDRLMSGIRYGLMEFVVN